jgi:NADH-quinone oxidoreductase subunit H
VFYLFAKAFLVYFVIMWIRYSVPRIRIDHMLNFNWKFLTPLALVLVLVTALLVKLLESASPTVFVVVMLAANLIIAWITLTLVRRFARSLRRRVSLERPLARGVKPPVSTIP